MWQLWLLGIAAYCVLTYYSLLEASSPSIPCPEDTTDSQHHPCFRPSVVPGDRIGLHLELFHHGDDDDDDDGDDGIYRAGNKRWIGVPSCRLNITLPRTGRLPILVTNTTDSTTTTKTTRKMTTNETLEQQQEQQQQQHQHDDDDDDDPHWQVCNVPIPAFARHRSDDPSSVKPLRARFLVLLLEGEDETKTAVKRKATVAAKTTIPFTLTKIQRREPSLFGRLPWTTTSSSLSVSPDTAPARNLLQDPLANYNRTTEEDSDQQEQPAVTTTMYVPVLKYGRAPIRLRFVAEHRAYMGILQRADGITLQALNASHYAPMMYVDELALPHSAALELAPPKDAATKPPVTVAIKLSSLTPMVDTINRQVLSQVEFVETLLPGEELDEIRYFLSDERLYRFLLSQTISTVHMWLDYLAFRDEVRFYAGRQNLSGVSTSTVLTRLACSVIILLYLLDGGGTSWVVLLSLFSSCAIEAWKVWKLLRPRFHSTFPFVAIRELQTAQERDTVKYDQIAIRYLSWIMYPLICGLALYSLHKHEYRSWYSWFISNAANAVYSFGFISLCPQLYINYRLKSVAHMPWKMFVYKIFNTFVDDAFAFLIEMPWKHRLMTLRDDVVFLVFLYQAYIYRVDKTRTNEFGYCYEEEGGGKQGQQMLQEESPPGRDPLSEQVEGKLKAE